MKTNPVYKREIMVSARSCLLYTSMLAGYAEEARWSNAFLSMANRFDTVIVDVYKRQIWSSPALC